MPTGPRAAANELAYEAGAARWRAGRAALQGEFEVELEGADARGQLALLVAEGEPDLNELQKVDVGSQRLIVKVGGRLEGADGAGDDPWELCVLRTEKSGGRVRDVPRKATREGFAAEEACARWGGQQLTMATYG